ncbi:MAG: flavodoxin domain-containing protein [Deltaproteobacteria bacterium]|nr:flavodoxin domain-containing protein [Candidatus Anaeroferrophillacea bacterium]
MKALIVYCSTTGTTEQLAFILKEHLEERKITAVIEEAPDVDTQLIEDCDLLLLGCSTWGEGDLQEDFEKLSDRFEDIDFEGRIFAVFGAGDEDGYPDTFCAAVDTLEEKVGSLGGIMATPGLRISDGDDNVGARVRDWADLALEGMKQRRRS